MVCACAINGIDYGFFASFGAIFVDLLEEFGDTRTLTGAIQTVNASVGLCVSK